MKEQSNELLKKISSDIAKTNTLLRDLMIVELGLAGVSQKNIRNIVGGDTTYVNKVLKNIKTKE